MPPPNPTVVSISPADGASKVNRSQDIVLTFSEPMDSSSVANAFIAVPSITCTWTFSGNTATCAHSMLDAATEYSLALVVSAHSVRGPALATDFGAAFTTT